MGAKRGKNVTIQERRQRLYKTRGRRAGRTRDNTERSEAEAIRTKQGSAQWRAAATIKKATTEAIINRRRPAGRTRDNIESGGRGYTKQGDV